MTRKYLMIVRHGKSDRVDEIKEVGSSLRKLLKELPRSERITIEAMRYANTRDAESELTADVLGCEIGVIPVPAESKLTIGPERLSAWITADDAKRELRATREAIDRRVQELPDHHALILVGHAPAVDWLLADMCRTQIPLARSELVCLARRRQKGRWSAIWALTPSAADATESLQTKVASKMVVVSVLAGFVGAMLGQLLLDLPKGLVPRSLALAAAVLLALALTMLVGALLGYDRLGMPVRFWSPAPTGKAGEQLFLRRPPSSSAWVVYQHSVRLWRWVGAALILAALGVAALALSVTSAGGWVAWVSTGGVVVVIAIVGAVAWRIAAPRLGAED